MNPFPLTTGVLSMIKDFSIDAYKGKDVGFGIIVILATYGFLAPAFITDFCFFLPISIIDLVIGDEDKDREQ